MQRSTTVRALMLAGTAVLALRRRRVLHHRRPGRPRRRGHEPRGQGQQGRQLDALTGHVRTWVARRRLDANFYGYKNQLTLAPGQTRSLLRYGMVWNAFKPSKTSLGSSGGSAVATALKAVPFTFTQAIGATDALRTGTYTKTLTFTLSATTP